MVGTHGRLVHVGRQHEAIGGGQRQPHEEAERDRQAIGGVAAQARRLERASPGGAEFARQREGEAHSARHAHAKKRGGAAEMQHGEEGPERESTPGRGHVEEGVSAHLARRPATLLRHLQEAAGGHAHEADPDGQLQRGAERQEEQERARDQRQGHGHGGEGAVESGVEAKPPRFVLGGVEARHGRLDPDEEAGGDDAGDGEGQRIVAVLRRRQHAGENDDRAEAGHRLHHVHGQIAQHALPEHGPGPPLSARLRRRPAGTAGSWPGCRGPARRTGARCSRRRAPPGGGPPRRCGPVHASRGSGPSR